MSPQRISATVIRAALFVQILVGLALCIVPTLPSLESSETRGSESATINLKCKGIKASKGHIMVAVYGNKSSFMSDDMVLAKKLPISGKGEFTARLVLPKGSCAIAVYHDINSNGKLDKNVFFYPTEPYGFSNNARGIAGPPSWNDALISVENEMELTISLE